MENVFGTEKMSGFRNVEVPVFLSFFIYRKKKKQNRDFKIRPVFREFRFSEGPVL